MRTISLHPTPRGLGGCAPGGARAFPITVRLAGARAAWVLGSKTCHNVASSRARAPQHESGTDSVRSPVLQRIARAVLRKPMLRMWPLDVKGADAIPADGAAILCANHLSFFDSVFIVLTVDRPVYFIGKADYLDSWKTRRLFPALGMIPIDRDSGKRAMVALDVAAGVLNHGSLLCVYPEGSRSRDGRLHRGHTGAARLAIDAECPILPIGITGTQNIQPPGAKLPRRAAACSISIGAPLTADSTPASGRRVAARALTDRLMSRIAELSSQEYVAQYTRRPERALAVN